MYFSLHHMNTEKVARAMAKSLGTEAKSLQQIDPTALSDFGLVGFGSGIYHRRHHKTILDFIDQIHQSNGKKAFIFSTSGSTGKSAAQFHKPLKEKLMSKGFTIIGEFNCAGYDAFSFYRAIGGLNKGRPNEEDIREAELFTQVLKAAYLQGFESNLQVFVPCKMCGLVYAK